jgi:hypothetical protein
MLYVTSTQFSGREKPNYVRPPEDLSANESTFPE